MSARPARLCAEPFRRAALSGVHVHFVNRLYLYTNCMYIILYCFVGTDLTENTGLFDHFKGARLRGVYAHMCVVCLNMLDRIMTPNTIHTMRGEEP